VMIGRPWKICRNIARPSLALRGKFVAAPGARRDSAAAERHRRATPRTQREDRGEPRWLSGGCESAASSWLDPSVTFEPMLLLKAKYRCSRNLTASP
jgi:hypothetical protein